MSGLQLDNLVVKYGSGAHAFTAVDGVSFEVPLGQIVALVGESGSGKSTIAKAVVGLEQVADGSITLEGKPVKSYPPGTVQMVFQDPFSSLDPRRTVGFSIHEAMRGRRSRSDARKEIARLLELVELRERMADVRPSELSGGQRQRVGLARALAANPKVIIADEMTSALDVSVQGAVLNLLRDLQSELSLTWLFITHNLAVARYISHSVIVLNRGKVVEAGEATTVLEHPSEPYTQQLLAAVPRRRARLVP